MATGSSAGKNEGFAGTIRELLLLESAEENAGRRSADQQAALQELAAAIDARASAADALSSSEQTPPAFVLLREATVLATRALLVSQGDDLLDASVDAAFTRLVAVAAERGLTLPEGLDRARAVLTAPGPLAFDQLKESDAAAARADVEATLTWLRAQFDARSVRQIRASRMFRMTLTGIALGGALAWGLVWGARKLFSPKNLALGKPVQMSSSRPSMLGSGPTGLPASGLTDGSRGGAYDVCTNSEANPWIIVDLQRSERLGKVKIYNRADCCWGAHDLPAVLEISEDGAAYARVADRTTPYSDADPWVIPMGGKTARFLRVRVEGADSRELVLNELEAFAP